MDTRPTEEKSRMEEHRDDTGSRLGMWLFVLSELLLFGGMFILYAVHRYKAPGEFHHGSMELEPLLGTLNTVILLTSSLTVALSIDAVKKGRHKSSVVLLIATVALGVLFLGNKGLEWGTKIGNGVYPNSPVLLSRPKGEILFFGLYYVTTGLHGLHVLAGVFLLLIMLILLKSERIHQGHFVPFENAGLYWHLVDIVWIFLFPLFYLIA